jgi:predicted nucleic-acid-binding Zn-ribbon protein
VEIKVMPCYKCGNNNLVDGTLGTSTQPVVNLFKGNALPPFQKLKTVTCLNCGFIEIHLDRD